MRSDYLKYNQIARNLSIDSFRLNENADVDNLMKRIDEILASNFKKIVFDIASDKNRNPDSFRAKVEQIKGSSSVKNLAAKLKDLCSDVEIVDPSFAEIKQFYLQSLSEVAEAAKRAVELDPSLESKFIESFEKTLQKIQGEMDKIAKESISESLGIGYSGRAKRLNKILVSLISDSRGKDAKSGYGRDWQRLFSQLEQKLKAISLSDKHSVSDKDRKELMDLEKKVDNLSQEYNQYKVKAAELAMQKIQKDDDLSQKMSDVNDLLTTALDAYTRAFTQEGIVEVKAREEMEDKESKMNDRVFPLKLGDKDSDARLKNSNIISSLQKALIDAYSPIRNVLTPRGGADGKFEAGTSAAIKAIQGSLDNKNVDGKVDKSLLDSILKLDQVSAANKDALKKSLEVLRSSYANLSESSVVGAADFMRMFENKTYIDPDRIEDELKKYSDDLATMNNVGESMTSDAMMAERLAKSLRTKGYNKNAEAEDFLREDGTLKGSYPQDFVLAWTEAVNGDKDVSYFFIQDDKGRGSLYPAKRLSTNVNKPCNWDKYSSMLGKDNEDIDDYGKWYTSYYKNFAGVDKDTKCSPIDDVFGKNAELASEYLKEMEAPYRSCVECLKPSSDYIEYGYIPMKALEGVCSVVESICGDDIDLDKMSPAEQRLLYNSSVFLAPLVSYDKKNDSWGCALEMMLEKFDVDVDDLMKKITKSSSFRSKSPMMKESMCSLVPVKESEHNSHCLECMELNGGVSDDNMGTIKDTARKIPAILKSKGSHIKRMGITDLDSIPSDMMDNIYVVSIGTDS